MKNLRIITEMNKRRNTTYTFQKLSEDARQTVLESMREWMVDEGWWEDVYDRFENICATIGVEVDVKQIFFNCFYSQGSGAKFAASVNIHELVKGINKKTYLENYPGLQKEVSSFTPQNCTVNPRILDLIQRDWIDLTIHVDTSLRCYSSKTRVSWNYTYNECRNYKHIENEMTALESWITDIIAELDNLLHRQLENQYDYLTSDRAITALIVDYNYRFTKEGIRA